MVSSASAAGSGLVITRSSSGRPGAGKARVIADRRGDRAFRGRRCFPYLAVTVRLGVLIGVRITGFPPGWDGRLARGVRFSDWYPGPWPDWTFHPVVVAVVDAHP